MPRKNLNVVGLFAGIGGIEQGFKNAKFTPLIANEIDEYAVKTYSKFHDHPVLHLDIKDFNKSTILSALKESGLSGNDLEGAILTGGFPCQPFSVAGYRKGFDDPRGNVFWEIHRLINELKPSVIFLENVKNLENHDGGRTFSTIESALQAEVESPVTGQKLFQKYFVTKFVLNAKNFGVPQNRERIFIVAFKSEKHLRAFLPHREALLENKLMLGDNALKSVIDFSSLKDEKYYYSPAKNVFYDELAKNVTEEGVIYQWRRQYVRANKSGVAPTLTANMGMGGHNVPIIKTSNTTFSPDGIRKLTPEECFALMGFKDAKSKFPPNVTDSRLYKQAGNAVVVDVIQAIADRIKLVLES